MRDGLTMPTESVIVRYVNTFLIQNIFLLESKANNTAEIPSG